MKWDKINESRNLERFIAHRADPKMCRCKWPRCDAQNKISFIHEKSSSTYIHIHMCRQPTHKSAMSTRFWYQFNPIRLCQTYSCTCNCRLQLYAFISTILFVSLWRWVCVTIRLFFLFFLPSTHVSIFRSMCIHGVGRWCSELKPNDTRFVHTAHNSYINTQNRRDTHYHSESVGICTSYIRRANWVHRMFLLLHHNVVAVALRYTDTRALTHTQTRARSHTASDCDSAEDMRVFLHIQNGNACVHSNTPHGSCVHVFQSKYNENEYYCFVYIPLYIRDQQQVAGNRAT